VATFLAIVVIAGIVLFADHIKTKNSAVASNLGQASASNTTSAATDNATTPTSDTSSTSTSTATPTTTTNASGYKDGTYTASSDYYVPHGDETIEVSLTVSNGVIVNASVQNSEGDNESARYQEDFASVYKSHVVGKKISGLQLGTIAGASDTTQGFDDALTQIASKARA
jgi:uncharacterized protein with FMN-binding domain